MEDKATIQSTTNHEFLIKKLQMSFKKLPQQVHKNITFF